MQGAILAYLVCSFFLSIQYLWFVYYPIAYAVSLGHIHAGEHEAPDAATRGQVWPRPAGSRGRIWGRVGRSAEGGV